MGFIPVYLRTSKAPTAQADRGDSFELPPAPRPTLAPKTGEIADTPPGRDRDDASDLADQLEVHRIA